MVSWSSECRSNPARSPHEVWDWPAVSHFCHRHARRWSPPTVDPQDVAQEAILRAWRMRHQCQDPARPWAWLARICQREAARVAARRQAIPLAEPPDVAVPAHEDEMVDRLAVGAAVAGLPALDRVLIALRYGHDQTHSRIAAGLALPEGTVKVRLHRVRRQLRPLLSDDD